MRPVTFQIVDRAAFPSATWASTGATTGWTDPPAAAASSSDSSKHCGTGHHGAASRRVRARVADRPCPSGCAAVPIHGDSDNVIPVHEARAFVDLLRSVLHAPVGYLEIPQAGHGFDLTDRWSTQAAVEATTQFLEAVRRPHHLSDDLQAI